MTPTGPTPFERLGGTVAIDAVVDVFYDRLVGDPEVFFDQVDLGRQRGHLKLFLAAALGGPNPYRGRELGEAHAHLGITDHSARRDRCSTCRGGRRHDDRRRGRRQTDWACATRPIYGRQAHARSS